MVRSNYTAQPQAVRHRLRALAHISTIARNRVYRPLHITHATRFAQSAACALKPSRGRDV